MARRALPSVGPRDGVSLGDCDGDGDLDVATSAGELLVRGPAGDFASSRPFGLAAGARAGVELGDVDGDGLTDALVAGDAVALFRGRGGCAFADPVVTAVRACDPGGAVVAMTPCDADLDGARDYWAVCSGNSRPVALLRGLGDGRFERVALNTVGLSGLRTTDLPVFSFFAEDLDDDGVLDGALLSDTGTGWFAWGTAGAPGDFALDETLSTIKENINTMSVASLDFERDGRLDMFWSGNTLGNVFYRYEGGRQYTNAGRAWDPSRAFEGQTWSAFAFDANRDGWDDVLALRLLGTPESPGGEQPAVPFLYVNQRNGRFADLAADALPPLQAYQAACGDLAGDGLPGCVVVGFRETVVLENHLEAAGGWAGVRLRGTVSDPEGIGALVSVRGLDRPSVHRVGPGAATYAHHAVGLLLPTGAADSLALHVRWPSGVEQDVPAVAAMGYATVVEPRVVRLSRRAAPADGVATVDVEMLPGAVGAGAATIEARGDAHWAGPAALVDGTVRRTLVAPAAPGVVALDLALDGVALRVHPRVTFQ